MGAISDKEWFANEMTESVEACADQSPSELMLLQAMESEPVPILAIDAV